MIRGYWRIVIGCRGIRLNVCVSVFEERWDGVVKHVFKAVVVCGRGNG